MTDKKLPAVGLRGGGTDHLDLNVPSAHPALVQPAPVDVGGQSIPAPGVVPSIGDPPTGAVWPVPGPGRDNPPSGSWPNIPTRSSAEPDVEERFKALQESDMRRAAEIVQLRQDMSDSLRQITVNLNEVAADVSYLKAAPPPTTTGWRAYVERTLLSSRFQAAIASIIGIVASALGGAIDGRAALVGILGVIVTYMTSRTFTDVHEAKADAQKATAAANLAIMGPRRHYD